MDKNLTKEAMLCDTMHRMIKEDNFPYLDMEDLILMWQSLAEKWGIYLDDDQWEEFTEEINSKASNKLSVFETIFYKYFDN